MFYLPDEWARTEHGPSLIERVASFRSLILHSTSDGCSRSAFLLWSSGGRQSTRLRWLQHAPVAAPPFSSAASIRVSLPRTSRDLIFLFFFFPLGTWQSPAIRQNEESRPRKTDTVVTLRDRQPRPTTCWLDSRTLHFGIDHGWREA